MRIHANAPVADVKMRKGNEEADISVGFSYRHAGDIGAARTDPGASRPQRAQAGAPWKSGCEGK